MKENIRKIILLISIIVFIYSSSQLIKIYLDYKKINDTNDKVVEQVVIEKVEPKDEPLSYLEINWDELKALNNDVIGWIQIPYSNINYPILKGSNNDSYIYHDIHKNYSKGGSIFIDERNNDTFLDQNTIIYGHNMKNNSMFGHIIDIVSNNEYYQEHPYIYIYLPNGSVYEYTIISTKYIDAYNPLYTPAILDYQNFYNQIKNNTNDIDLINYENQEPIIMLSTCATANLEDTSRQVVFAQRSAIIENPKDQQMKYYKVK